MTDIITKEEIKKELFSIWFETVGRFVSYIEVGKEEFFEKCIKDDIEKILNLIAKSKNNIRELQKDDEEMKPNNEQILLTCHSVKEREWIEKEIIKLFIEYRKDKEKE